MKGRLSGEARRDWLRLARTESVGSVAFAELLGRFGDAGAVIDALPQLARRPIDIPKLADIDRELEAGERIGARLLCAADPDYPYLLAGLDCPPPVLWALGDAALMKPKAVAIVGARIASAAGQGFANRLARDLGDVGYTVISGMARGIDGAAHEGAMSTGTVAVLGGGVDEVYPREHADLHRRWPKRGASSLNARLDIAPRPGTFRAATASSRACRWASSWSKRRCALGH